MSNVRPHATLSFVAALLLGCGTSCFAQVQTAVSPDIPAHFAPDESGFDYDRREVMIPMRDGVRLHTVLIVPKTAGKAPIMLDRTPYGADEMLPHGGAHMSSIVPRTFDVMTEKAYIVAVQDVRGKYSRKVTM